MPRNSNQVKIQRILIAASKRRASSLSGFKIRSEKVTGGGQILRILKANSYSIGRKSGEI